LIPYRNLAGRLIVLTVIVAIVSVLKGALEDEYEAERRGVQREFEIACEVQSRLLPTQAPDYPRLDFGFFYKPAREVGGDYYDFIPFDQERMGLAVGDVLLHDGDVLVAYTDGVVESLNPQQEEFGKKRLSDTVRSSLSFSAAEICKRIAEQLQAFVAKSPQWDDITLVVIKVKPA